MKLDVAVRLGAALVGLGAVGATTYAACCYINGSWNPPGEGQPPQVCSGTSATMCEQSSISCTPPTLPAGPHQHCRLTSDPRQAVCRKYNLTTGNWLRAPCDWDGTPGYTFVARLGDGSCCWVRGFTQNDTPIPTVFIVDCTTVCASIANP